MYFLLMDRPRKTRIGDVGGFMSVVFFMSILALLLLAEVEDDEDELERFLGSTRHSSRVTFASGRDGARDASRISVNFDVVMIVCRVS